MSGPTGEDRGSNPASVPVGPFAQAVSLNDGGGLRTRGSGSGKKGANALVVLRRTAFVTWSQDRCRTDDQAISRLLHWADQADLGQDRQLIARALARRTRSLRALADGGHTVARLHARVQWRLIAGMGAKDNAHEIGIALHGTYGWPVLPASGLKGMTAAWATRHITDTAAIGAVFGAPRPTAGQRTTPASRPDGGELPAPVGKDDQYTENTTGTRHEEASRGNVVFLDALPTDVATVRRDVLTPHVQPYYTAAERRRNGETGAARDGTTDPLVPPAEHHNPVPVTFLTVQDVTFAVDLAGRDANAVCEAAGWLANAADELGAGAKTSAGYGYLKVTLAPGWAPTAHPLPGGLNRT